MNNSNNNSEVLTELKKMTKLLALIAIEGKPTNEKILFLSHLDLSSPQIGELLGMKPDAVRQALHQARKKSQTKKKKE